MKFSIKDFFSKCGQIRSFLQYPPQTSIFAQFEVRVGVEIPILGMVYKLSDVLDSVKRSSKILSTESQEQKTA